MLDVSPPLLMLAGVHVTPPRATLLCRANIFLPLMFCRYAMPIRHTPYYAIILMLMRRCQRLRC